MMPPNDPSLPLVWTRPAAFCTAASSMGWLGRAIRRLHDTAAFCTAASELPRGSSVFQAICNPQECLWRARNTWNISRTDWRRRFGSGTPALVAGPAAGAIARAAGQRLQSERSGARGPGVSQVLPRRDQCGRAAGARREAAGRVLRAARPRGHDGAQRDEIDYAGPRAWWSSSTANATTSADRARLRRRLPRKRRRESPGARRPDRQPLPGRRQPDAVCRSRRQPRRRPLRAGERPQSRRPTRSRTWWPTAGRLYRHVGELRRSRCARERSAAAAIALVGAVVGSDVSGQLAELRPRCHTLVARPRLRPPRRHGEGLRRRVRRWPGRRSLTTSRGLIFAHARPEYRERFGDRPLAGSGRSGHARDDRATEHASGTVAARDGVIDAS